MATAIKTRELIRLAGDGVTIRGTYHKVHDDGSEAGRFPRDRMGVVFLNGLSATRAGHGDAVVSWADSLAERGYPSFRLDLPGCGDSAGDPPAQQLAVIDRGGYAPVLSVTIKELMARYNLAGVILAAHCSGTVSAIYTAAIASGCKGLVLMDPYFHHPQTMKPKIRVQLNLWSLRSRIGAPLRVLYDLHKVIRLFLRGKALPENANVPLLRVWKGLASSGLPMLILQAPVRKAPVIKPRVGEFDYLKYLLSSSGRNWRVDAELIDGANHSFSDSLGRTAVRRQTERWLTACFPLTEETGSDAKAQRTAPAMRNKEHKTLDQYIEV
jgi:pimeloyl-ACP methyl ester carboxylesterase